MQNKAILELHQTVKKSSRFGPTLLAGLTKTYNKQARIISNKHNITIVYIFKIRSALMAVCVFFLNLQSVPHSISHNSLNSNSHVTY